MSSLVFQASRRKLLAQLLESYNATSTRRDQLMQSESGSDDAGRPEEVEALTRRFNSLHAAVQAADEQVRRLEYWSDIKDMARQGQSKGAADEAQGRGREWRGGDDSGAAGMEGRGLGPASRQAREPVEDEYERKSTP